MSVTVPVPELETAGDARRRGPRPIARLGEELPLFCERCGYQLHGLPPVRCERCEVLHFSCPECGHHQPVNTLRPAAQRIIGRVRAVALIWSVFFRLNFFGWLLFAWCAMGYEWAYQYRYIRAAATAQPWNSGRNYEYVPRALELEVALAFGIFALAFGLVSRMFLLRWRRSWVIGLVLSALAVTAVCAGALIRQRERDIPASPFAGGDLPLVLALTALALSVGVMISWPLWVMVVRLFLPARTGTALLEWQRSLAGPVDQLAR